MQEVDVAARVRERALDRLRAVRDSAVEAEQTPTVGGEAPVHHHQGDMDGQNVLSQSESGWKEHIEQRGLDTKSVDSKIAWRVAAMRPQVPSEGAVPFLVAKPELKPLPGQCTSCGDSLENGN